MKKLLVLTLVLGLASIANATFSLTVDGVDPGAEYDLNFVTGPNPVAIGVYNDTQGANQWQFAVAMSLPTTASWTGGNNIYVPPNTPGNVNTYVGTGIDPTKDVWYAPWANGIPTDFYGVGVLGDFELLCSAVVGDVVIELLDVVTAGMPTLDTLTIHQIPEPATMLLLGLGGLLLRRRK